VVVTVIQATVVITMAMPMVMVIIIFTGLLAIIIITQEAIEAIGATITQITIGEIMVLTGIAIQIMPIRIITETIGEIMMEEAVIIVIEMKVEAKGKAEEEEADDRL
jgi:hypothetical protein